MNTLIYIILLSTSLLLSIGVEANSSRLRNNSIANPCFSDRASHLPLPSRMGTNTIVRPPHDYAPSKPWPLIVFFSGATFTASMTEEDTGFTAPANRQGYMVAYLDHIVPNSNENMRMAATVVKEIQKTWCIEPRRIYLTGHSDGGSMAHLLLLKNFIQAAAIAPSASGLELQSLTRISCIKNNIPILSFHSQNDKMFPIVDGYGKGVSQWFSNCSDCKKSSLSNHSKCVTHSSCSNAEEIKYCQGIGPHGHWPASQNQKILDFFSRF